MEQEEQVFAMYTKDSKKCKIEEEDKSFRATIATPVARKTPNAENVVYVSKYFARRSDQNKDPNVNSAESDEKLDSRIANTKKDSNHPRRTIELNLSLNRQMDSNPEPKVSSNPGPVKDSNFRPKLDLNSSLKSKLDANPGPKVDSAKGDPSKSSPKKVDRNEEEDTSPPKLKTKKESKRQSKRVKKNDTWSRLQSVSAYRTV